MGTDEIVDQIFARVGCFRIAEWLSELAQTLEFDIRELMPIWADTCRFPLGLRRMAVTISTCLEPDESAGAR